jgi:hypothetical protein
LLLTGFQSSVWDGVYVTVQTAAKQSVNDCYRYIMRVYKKTVRHAKFHLCEKFLYFFEKTYRRHTVMMLRRQTRSAFLAVAPGGIL